MRVEWARVVSYGGLLYAAFGWLNQSYLGWIHGVWVIEYSLPIVILVFGVWRVAAAKLRYVKIRIAVLTFLVATWWLLIPLLTHSNFLDFHVIGSVAFFAYLIVIFLFGRRADCGWNCTCVGVRDTAGDVFRRNTLRGERAWKFRHVKWIFLAPLLGYLLLTILTPALPTTWVYQSSFNQLFSAMFFASLLVIPVTGNRSWCRYICPWGALYGLVSRFGFYKIEADLSKCTECAACDRVCEMGIPVSSLIQKFGQVKVSDCVGCGWCVSSCPTKALQFKDVRNYLKPLAHKLGGTFTNVNQ